MSSYSLIIMSWSKDLLHIDTPEWFVQQLRVQNWESYAIDQTDVFHEMMVIFLTLCINFHWITTKQTLNHATINPLIKLASPEHTVTITHMVHALVKKKSSSLSMKKDYFFIKGKKKLKTKNNLHTPNDLKWWHFRLDKMFDDVKLNIFAISI